MHASLEEVFRRFGIRSVLRKMPGARIATGFSIRVGFELDDSTTGVYSLSIDEGQEGASVIREERCEVGEDWFTYIGGSIEQSVDTAPAITGDRPALAAFGALPQFSPVFNLIAGFRVYAPEPKSMRLSAPIGPGRILFSEASNATDVLGRACSAVDRM
jgi:hypothetical protein